MWSADNYNKAMRFAGQWHGNQQVPGTRISYLLHLAQVSQQALLATLADQSLDADLVMLCAILHDVLEDTQCPFETLKSTFGEAVANGVLALSKQKFRNGQSLTKREQMLDSLERIENQPREVWVVKLADRITNLQEPPAHWYEREGKIASYLDEARVIYNKLGSASDYLSAVMTDKMTNYQKFLR